MAEQRHRTLTPDELIDEDGAESFPASDPPSYTSTSAGGPGHDEDAAPTTEQVRDAIDSGKTGDKVKASDPAAAPLGADDEAAGHPPSSRERRMNGPKA